jgi:hypothetical protein
VLRRTKTSKILISYWQVDSSVLRVDISVLQVDISLLQVDISVLQETNTELLQFLLNRIF